MNFLITALAVYGLSALISEYEGPFEAFKRLRGKYPNSALTCVVCTSVWLAVPISLISIYFGVEWLIPSAIVGAVIVGERI